MIPIALVEYETGEILDYIDLPCRPLAGDVVPIEDSHWRVICSAGEWKLEQRPTSHIPGQPAQFKDALRLHLTVVPHVVAPVDDTTEAES
jgi:hypothetical protein